MDEEEERSAQVQLCFVFILIHFLVKGLKDHFGKACFKIINGMMTA